MKVTDPSGVTHNFGDDHIEEPPFSDLFENPNFTLEVVCQQYGHETTYKFRDISEGQIVYRNGVWDIMTDVANQSTVGQIKEVKVHAGNDH